MKTALTSNGQAVEANQDAPEAAVCPQCSCPVTLRKRSSMSGEVTYFWRHSRGHSLTCRKRSSPVGRNAIKRNNQDFSK